jgi:hypothetical protein
MCKFGCIALAVWIHNLITIYHGFKGLKR